MRCALVCGFILLLAALPPVGAQPGPPAPVLDAKIDARLARRVRLRVEGIRGGRVLQQLAETTGVRLEAEGRAGDERLVAFVPAAPLGDVLAAIADLYRLEWSRLPRSEPAHYRLAKAVPAGRDEQEPRDRAFREVVEGLTAPLRGARPPGGAAEAWAPVYPCVLPSIQTRAPDLLRDGYLSLPVASFPGSLRPSLIAALQPILNEEHRRFQEVARQLEQRQAAAGQEPAAIVGAAGPPPVAATCSVT